MAGRVIRSDQGKGPATKRGQQPETVKPEAGEKRAPRTASSSGAEALSDAVVSRSTEGGFVDARALSSEDMVGRTLEESSGILGLATRPKVIDFQARLKERKRASIRMTALRVAAIVAGVAALATLVWLLFFSPVLRLETDHIKVSGANEWVSEADVSAIVGEQAGRSLLIVNTNAMREAMTGIPGVTNAEVKRDFPHGITVTITAQRPAAMLKSGDDSMTAVDSKGRVLNSVPGANVQGVPVIEVDDVDKALSSRSVKETLKVLNTLPEQWRQAITKVTARTQDSVRTELNGGERVIVWGDASDMKLKKAVVDKIMNDPNVIGDKHEIDVSAPLRPVLR